MRARNVALYAHSERLLNAANVIRDGAPRLVHGLGECLFVGLLACQRRPGYEYVEGVLQERAQRELASPLW